MSNPSTPFPWKGDARRAGGWPKGNESEANLRRYAPPPSKGRRENALFLYLLFVRKRRAALLSSLRFDFSLFLPKAQVPCYNG